MERRLGGEIPAPDSPAQRHFDKGSILYVILFCFKDHITSRLHIYGPLLVDRYLNRNL